MACLASIDIGTTLIKAGIFDSDLRLLGLGSQPFGPRQPRRGWHELAPGDCWAGVCKALRDALHGSGADAGDVAGIGLSSQGQTFLPLDAQGRPLHNFIVWTDGRAQEQAAEIDRHFGPEEVYRRTGVSRLIAGHTAPAILWLRRNRPDLFRKTAKFLLAKDYVLFRMTGRAVIDVQLAGSTACWDVEGDCWWGEMLDFIGISPERLARPCAAPARVGEPVQSAAEELGIPRSCRVTAGTWDQISGAIGAANVRPGPVTEMTGSCLAVVATTPDFVTDPERRMLAGRHAVSEQGYLLPYTEYAGAALQWIRDRVYDPSMPYDRITEEASAVPIGCEDLDVLLGRTGADEIGQAFAGLKGSHTRAHMARAVMEAVAFALRGHVEALCGVGVRVESVTSLGGGARSDVWLQMKADALGKPVKRPECVETGLLGAAILAGVGADIFDDVAETARELVRIRDVFEPDHSHRALYDEAYARHIERRSAASCRCGRGSS